MGTNLVSATGPSPDPAAEVVVPHAATVVIAPTPQDRALVVADDLSCACPPSIVSDVGHLPGCPAAD